MHDHRRVWILLADFVDAARGELDVDLTGALAQIHFVPDRLLCLSTL